MHSSCGQNKQAVQSGLASLVFNVAKQTLSVSEALISRIDRQRSHFPEFFLRELIKRGTPVDHTVVFKNREVRDVAFKFFAWAFDQRSVRLKRLQQFDQTRDVVRGCLTQGLQIFHGHHGSHAVMRKELSQKSSVHCVGHDVNAFNAVFKRFQGKRQVVDIFFIDEFVVNELSSIFRGKFRDHFIKASDTIHVGEQNKLVGF